MAEGSASASVLAPIVRARDETVNSLAVLETRDGLGGLERFRRRDAGGVGPDVFAARRRKRAFAGAARQLRHGGRVPVRHRRLAGAVVLGARLWAHHINHVAALD